MGRDFQTEKVLTARTEHRCEESGCRRTRTIAPGTKYVRVAGCSDGYMYSASLCLRCRRLARKVWRLYPWSHPDDGPALGETLYYVRERRLYDGPRPRGGWGGRRTLRPREGAPA